MRKIQIKKITIEKHILPINPSIQKKLKTPFQFMLKKKHKKKQQEITNKPILITKILSNEANFKRSKFKETTNSLFLTFLLKHV